MPTWGKPLVPYRRNKVLMGGRGSGKSWFFARLLVMKAYQKRTRAMCTREVQKTLKDSAHRNIKRQIERLGLGDGPNGNGFFAVHENRIIGRNGSEFMFQGLSDSAGTSDSARSWEDIDVCWVEEAQFISQRSIETMEPSVRNPQSEIWYSFNPRYRTDAVYRKFVTNKPPDDEAIVVEINYDQNDWFPRDLEIQRLACLRDEPERYNHIWLGKTDDEGEERIVLPFGIIERCVDAHIELELDLDKLRDGRIDGGLDVAESGVDSNVLVLRQGPVIFKAERWNGDRLGYTARRAHRACMEYGVRRLFYDVGGLGAGIRSHLWDLQEAIPDRTLPYVPEPTLFGGEIKGPNEEYDFNVPNKDWFSYRNSQLAWALRLRARRTVNLLDGEGSMNPKDKNYINPADCLFIDSRGFEDDNGRDFIEYYLSQMSQPQWKEGGAGKLHIDKLGGHKEGEVKSPDEFDASGLAFGWDSEYGLRANR